MSDTTLRHVEHFVNSIGPRGSTTPQEKQAHDYCQATLEGLGYAAQREEFTSPLSGWRPYALALGLMLVADALFVLIGRGPDAQTGGPNAQMGAVAAAALGLITLVSFVRQSMLLPNPLQWFMPLGRSQNVWAVAEPRGEARRSVVLVGHVDTHRTALAMQSPQMWRVFQVLTTLNGIALVALLALFVWGIFTAEPLPRTIGLYLGLLPIVGLVFTLQPDFTPYVKGANDNATGAAAVLAFAERLQPEPLEHTRVYLVNTGCEEVIHDGLADWIRRHAAEAPGASYLVLDSIGGKGAGVHYVVDETILLPVKADSGLVALAAGVARENPEIAAQPFHYRGLYSELSTCVQRGQKALGLLNFNPQTGMPPNFHTPRDDMSNIDPELLDRSERFAWAVLQKIDQA